jgi:hypothetical protein
MPGGIVVSFLSFAAVLGLAISRLGQEVSPPPPENPKIPQILADFMPGLQEIGDYRLYSDLYYDGVIDHCANCKWSLGEIKDVLKYFEERHAYINFEKDCLSERKEAIEVDKEINPNNNKKWTRKEQDFLELYSIDASKLDFVILALKFIIGEAVKNPEHANDIYKIVRQRGKDAKLSRLLDDPYTVITTEDPNLKRLFGLVPKEFDEELNVLQFEIRKSFGEEIWVRKPGVTLGNLQIDSENGAKTTLEITTGYDAKVLEKLRVRLMYQKSINSPYSENEISEKTPAATPSELPKDDVNNGPEAQVFSVPYNHTPKNSVIPAKKEVLPTGISGGGGSSEGLKPPSTTPRR